MNQHIAQLQDKINPHREAIINHQIYSHINTIKDLKIFMEHHVCAVWDFMSLLKSLQKKLTCVDIPWYPVGTATTRFLINEIVVGEESDVDKHGNRISHFELYLQAMQDAGANTLPISQMVEMIMQTSDVNIAIKQNLSKAAQNFVNNTFEIINTDKSHVLASVFTFGREDLIPDMFHAIVEKMTKANPEKLDTFKYYLDRHIEVDGGHHSELALKMTTELCGENQYKWEEATDYAIKSLIARKELWDATLEAIKNQNN
jgi:hypothetical protein